MTDYTVDLGSEDYPVYADLSLADEYMDGALHGDTWRDSETDDTERARALVTATRILDRQNWLGDKVDADQALAWPRTSLGLTPEPAVDATSLVPVDIINATIELALALLEGADVQTQQNTSERIRSMSAGSVSITNFRGVDSETLRFPLIVHELINKYLSGSGSGTFAGKATGVDEETAFPIEAGLSGSI